MKAWSVIGLLFAAMIFATVPISPQVTPRGVELSVDQAQAITYRRARVTARRMDRRAYRSAAYAVSTVQARPRPARPSRKSSERADEGRPDATRRGSATTWRLGAGSWAPELFASSSSWAS